MAHQRRQETIRDLSPIELDRLAGLQQFIGEDLVQQVLDETHCRNRRGCRLTHSIMLWLVLAMGVLTDLPLAEVFRHARRLRPGQPRAKRAALCRARQRLGVAPVRHLFARVVRPLARPERNGDFYHGLHLVGIDGTVYDVPDSPANARVFGRPTGGRGDGAFPQVRKLSLVELGTHAELALLLKPCRCSEVAMLPGLLPHLRAGMLLLCDRNFFSYRLVQQVRQQQAHLLFRVKRGPRFEPIQALADGSFLAKIYPNRYDRRVDRNGILVRIIRYTLDDPQRVGHQETHTLITTLLDATQHPALELILLYHERWEQELVYDEQKTHQAPRCPGKEAQVRSETPAGVIQELYALSVAHYVVRALMAEAADTAGVEPDRLSFIGCLRILRCRLPECSSAGREQTEAWFAGLVWEMGQEVLPQRRNRVNPRVVKRKMSKFAKKRPQHRPVPRLTKEFVESVVLVT
jgi:Insertion element 4 transposase N-terminal/Transposase DDE domain